MWKVGDRVVVTQESETDSRLKLGMKGKVIFIEVGSFLSILVEFNSPSLGLHDGDGRGKDRQCFWLKDRGVFLEYERAICSRQQRKNNYY